MIPKAALICLSSAIAEDTETADIAIGIGATDGVSQWAFATFADDAQTTINVKRFGVKDGCIIIGSVTDITAKANFISFIENGIRIAWSQVSGVAHKGFVVFFSGPTLQAKVGTLESPPKDDGVVVEDVGFRSELLYVASAFLKFGVPEDRFGISQGFYFTGQYEDKRAINAFAGADGLTTSVDSVTGENNRRHFTRNAAGVVAVDQLDGDIATAVRGALNIIDITGEGFTAVASNSLAALKDFGYMALSFAGRARITQMQWDITDKPDGTYMQNHDAGQIENLEAVLLVPIAPADFGANANVGLGVLSGSETVAAFGRGSAALATGTREKTSFSSGALSFPPAVPGDNAVNVTFTGWSEGYTGWNYTLSNGPNADRTFGCLVIGRLDDCFPLSWHQAQLMENT